MFHFSAILKKKIQAPAILKKKFRPRQSAGAAFPAPGPFSWSRPRRDRGPGTALALVSLYSFAWIEAQATCPGGLSSKNRSLNLGWVFCSERAGCDTEFLLPASCMPTFIEILFHSVMYISDILKMAFVSGPGYFLDQAFYSVFYVASSSRFYSMKLTFHNFTIQARNGLAV